MLRRSFEATEPAMSCPACGHANDTAQRFCGMCGTPLPMSAAASFRPPEPELRRQRSWHDQDRSETEIVDERDEPESSFDRESRVSYPNVPLPSFASLSEDGASDDSGLFQYESRPVRRNFRIYIGLGLVIVLGLLVYKTWRGNASFRASHTAPAALPTEAPNATQSAPAANATPTPPPPAAQQNTSSNAAANQAESVPSKQNEAPPKPTASKAEVNRTPHAAAESENPAIALGQSGAAELAVGEKYLNGGPGTARDSREAASWLWKAVAKKNPTATLLLSDLYLHGDGVPKSCDQARLLLDAAARKGNAAAAERLRNMSAFGCQ